MCDQGVRQSAFKALAQSDMEWAHSTVEEVHLDIQHCLIGQCSVLDLASVLAQCPKLTMVSIDARNTACRGARMAKRYLLEHNSKLRRVCIQV